MKINGYQRNYEGKDKGADQVNAVDRKMAFMVQQQAVSQVKEGQATGCFDQI